MARPLATDMISRYTAAKTQRNMHENDWRMASAYCLPRHYSAWTHDGIPNYGGATSAVQTRRVSYDSTGVLALPKYVAILERLATPHSMVWHNVVANDRSLMRKSRVRAYYEELNRMLYTQRYAHRANFRRSSAEVYAQLGVYGTGPVYTGQRTPNALSRTPSLLYKACPLRDIFILLNDEGEVDTVFRRFYLNVRQFKQKFPNDPLPKCMAGSVIDGKAPDDNKYWEFFHVVQPRTDHDPMALDSRRHPIVSSYVCVAEQEYVGDESGFRSMPYLTPRTMTESGDAYGFSPAMQALPALGTASAMKKTILKQGQKAADPVLLAHDDGVMNGPVDLRPGAVNYGGVDKQGRKMIQALDGGNFNIATELLQEERRDINDSFFVTLFQILTETPEMTATEVMERVAEKAALLSPTMGALQSEFLGPCLEREIDILIEMGKIADRANAPGLQMPPELIEAQGEYEIIYTSPMAKAMYAEEISGFMRSVEMATNLVNATKDPSHLDHFNFDTAIPEIADYLAVPSRWMNDEERKGAIKDSRDEQAQESEIIQNAGPIAGALKAAQGLQQGTEAP